MFAEETKSDITIEFDGDEAAQLETDVLAHEAGSLSKAEFIAKLDELFVAYQ